MLKRFFSFLKYFSCLICVIIHTFAKKYSFTRNISPTLYIISPTLYIILNIFIFQDLAAENRDNLLLQHKNLVGRKKKLKNNYQ